MAAPDMAGMLIAVVGPSGAGKDSLIDAARLARPDIFFARRMITRKTEACGEAFDGVSPAEFAQRRAEGAFAIHWQAHGLHYGVPKHIEAVLAQGRNVVFNGSRATIAGLRMRYAPFRVIAITASPAVLAARLSARGREDRQDIERRLSRAAYQIPQGPDVRVIANENALEDAQAAFMAALPPAGTGA